MWPSDERSNRVQSYVKLVKYDSIQDFLAQPSVIHSNNFHLCYFICIHLKWGRCITKPCSIVTLPGLICSGKIVLSGDHKQLGPVVQSRLASDLGLDQSPMERLMNSCIAYMPDANGNLDANFATMLCKNFRLVLNLSLVILTTLPCEDTR